LVYNKIECIAVNDVRFRHPIPHPRDHRANTDALQNTCCVPVFGGRLNITERLIKSATRIGSAMWPFKVEHWLLLVTNSSEQCYERYADNTLLFKDSNTDEYHPEKQTSNDFLQW